jgi:hypothetical protein
MKKTPHLTLEDLPLPVEEAHFVIEYCKDLDIHRAAAACGLAPERAFDLRFSPDVNTQIQRVLQSHLTIQDINADWLMQELYYVHLLALQSGKLSVSLQTLKTLGALGKVDAYAAEKVELKSDRDVVQRLMRERKRRLGADRPDIAVEFNTPNGKPSFL